MKIYDLSVPIDPGAGEPMPPKIEYLDHAEGARQAAPMFGLRVEDFAEGKAWANETVTMTTHTGTHLDAPYHYWPRTAGRPALTIDQVPLEWCFGPGVLLDFHHKQSGETISLPDIQEELERISYTLQPGDIVLIRTDADKKFYSPDYGNAHPGISAEATRWLILQGIKVMGTDGWGWDVPFSVQAKEFKRTGDSGVLWAAHFVGKELEYCHIEKLANLDQLPRPFGFQVACFPIKIKGASAGWARPVAIFDY